MSATQMPTIRKFNPGLLQTDEEIMAQYSVRQVEFRTVLRIIRENIDSPSCQHILVYAPRGRGKTMLLARLAAECRTNPELSSHALPVRLTEDILEVFTLAEFWLEVLFCLSRELATDNLDLSRDLHKSHIDLKSRWRERELAERVRAAVMDTMARLDRHLVLMVENLQSLTDITGEQFGWGLRQALQTEPDLTLVATATSRFEALDDVKHAFYELFYLVYLPPLDTKSCHHLWQVVGGRERSEMEIEPIRVLTGGSPRLLVIVANFARHMSLGRLLDELVTLIDNHTEYFRSQLESMPKMERRVYLALVDLWRPSTAGEIAERASLDIRMVSTMLGRLIKRGATLVNNADRKRYYSAAEGLYCIYYKLRRERGEALVVRDLIRFMRIVFTDAEQRKIFAAIDSNAHHNKAIMQAVNMTLIEDPDFRKFIPSSLIDSDITMEIVGTHTTIDSFNHDFQQVWDAINQERYEKAIELIELLMARFDNSYSPVEEIKLATALIMIAQTFQELECHKSAIMMCMRIIERFDNHSSMFADITAFAYVIKGSAEEALGQTTAALRTFNEIIERYNTDDGLESKFPWVSTSLLNKGIILGKTGNWEEAIEAWNDLISRANSKSLDRELDELMQLLVAEAMSFKAFKLLHLEQFIEAEETARRLIGHCDKEWKESFLEQLTDALLADALFVRAMALHAVGDIEEAVTTSERMIRHFGANGDPNIRWQIVRTLVVKAWMDIEIGRANAALHACEEGERRLEDLEEEEQKVVRRRLGWARMKAHVIREDRASARNVYRSIWAEYDADEEADLEEFVFMTVEVLALDTLEAEMLEVLDGDRAKGERFHPLRVGLRRRVGVAVREPPEIIAVADRIDTMIEERKSLLRMTKARDVEPQ